MSKAPVDLYNYFMFSTNNKSGHKSGQIIEVAKVPNLAIVDIDLHRT